MTYKSNCVLYANSEVHWIPPAIYHSSCSIDVQYFPFDQQTCEMKFGSWTHKGAALKYSFYKNRDKLDLVDYLKSGSWDIIDCPGRIEPYKDDDNAEAKELIVFEFVIRRKSLFYTVNLIIPCVLISFVTVCVFALPADAGEKIALCISLLLALVVFLLLVSKILPPSLHIPLIAKYLLFTFVMNLVAILSTVIIINRNYRTPRTHRMPYWVRVVFLRELPKYLLMTRPDHHTRWQGAPTPAPSFQVSDNCTGEQDTPGDLVELSAAAQPQSPRDTPASSEYENIRCRLPRERRPAQGESSGAGSSQQAREETMEIVMTTELKATIESVKFIYQHLKDEEEYETVSVAVCLFNRFLLLVHWSPLTEWPCSSCNTMSIHKLLPISVDWSICKKKSDELLAHLNTTAVLWPTWVASLVETMHRWRRGPLSLPHRQVLNPPHHFPSTPPQWDVITQ